MQALAHERRFGDESKMLVAPAASSFPAHPAAWYVFCETKQLRQTPLAKRILGRDLVAFRTASGRYAVLNARCSHLGANLGCGTVVNEAIQCPFHHWQFGRDGRCVDIPGLSEIPAFAHQQSYPARERHGFLFFFNGAKPLFPLPFFEDESPAELKAGKMFSYEADASWFMVAGQGFDRQHFQTVHDRRLLSPPQVSTPSPFCRRNWYHAEIIGESTRDRLLKLLVGSTVTLSIQNWGGTFYVVKAQFQRACSRFLVSFRPLEHGRTQFDVIVYARRGIPALGLMARRWFTRAHLVSEAARIRDTVYRPARLTAADADLVDCFRWLAALPQQPPEANGDLRHLAKKKVL